MVAKCEGKKPLEDLGVDVRPLGVEWNNLAENMDQWRTVVKAAAVVDRHAP